MSPCFKEMRWWRRRRSWVCRVVSRWENRETGSTQGGRARHGVVLCQPPLRGKLANVPPSELTLERTQEIKHWSAFLGIVQSQHAGGRSTEFKAELSRHRAIASLRNTPAGASEREDLTSVTFVPKDSSSETQIIFNSNCGAQ